MPRKGPAPRRELMPDPIYRSVVVTQLVNKILQRGKRSTAEKIVYEALEIIQAKTGAEAPRRRRPRLRRTDRQPARQQDPPRRQEGPRRAHRL